MLKSLSIHTEMVFSRVLSNFEIDRQGKILSEISALVTSKRIRPIATRILRGLTAETMKDAHELLESSRTIGKVIIITA